MSETFESDKDGIWTVSPGEHCTIRILYTPASDFKARQLVAKAAAESKELLL